MEHNGVGDFSGHSSKLMGAIFMSCRATKKECFKRKIFGLPASQAGFVRKVKAGMFLFLFEHEERKLYGVFEAQTDGAMNVVPNAFLQSRASYPAQVRFKILWRCHPLCEDEFSGAIEENYFTPNKFKFGLSHKQVIKLIHLFSSKRVIPTHPSSGVHNINANFENSSLSNTRVTGRVRPVSFETTEKYIESDIGSTRNGGLSGLNMNYTMFHENADFTSEDDVLDPQHRLYPTDPSGFISQLPSLIPPTSQIDHTLRGSLVASPSGELPYYHNFPSFKGAQPSNALGMKEPSLDRKLTDAQSLYLRSHSYPLQPDSVTFELPSANYLNLDVSSCHKDLPITDSDSLLAKDYANFQSYSHMSCPNCHDYATSKNYTAEVSDSLKPILGLKNARGHPKSSQEECSVRGHYNPDFNLLEDEKLARDLEHSRSLSSYSSDIYEDNEYEGMWAHYFLQNNQNYPTATSQSDTVQRRPSVFSRLSGAPGALKHKKDPSVDQLLGLLSQRKKQLNMMPRIAKKLNTWNYDVSNYDDEQMKNIAEIEINEADSVAELKPSNDAMTEGGIELPFLNFKRRSKAQKVEGETEGGASVEDGKGKCKRRKLLRPSFTEEDNFMQVNVCQNAQSSEDIGNMNTLSLEAMNPRNNVEVSGDCRIESTATVKTFVQTPFGMTSKGVLNSEDNWNGVSRSDGYAESFPIESGINCTKARGERREAESDEKFHRTGDESIALPVLIITGGDESDDVCKKSDASERNKNNSFLKADFGVADQRFVNGEEDNIKDVVISDRIAGSISVEYDRNHAKATAEKLGEESEKRFHVVGDGNFALSVLGECEGNKLDDVCEYKVTFDLNQNPSFIDVNVGNVDLMDPKDNGEDSRDCITEGTITIDDGSILISENGGKDSTISDGNAETFSIGSDIYDAGASSGKLVFQGKCEGKQCDEDGKMNETFKANTEHGSHEVFDHNSEASKVGRSDINIRFVNN